MSSEERISINGARLRVLLDGPEDAPAVVLAHSLGTDARLWDMQVPALAQRYRVLRYDARGHGASDPPAGTCTIDLLADDLLGLMAYFDVTRGHVVGISLGALTAIAVAARNLPEVASVAICHTRADLPTEMARAIDERNALVRAGGIAALGPTQPQRWLAPATITERPDLVERVRSMFLGTSPEGFVACAEAIKTGGLADKLAAIKTPALFVAASEDQALPSDVIRAMADQVEGAQFAEIAGGGHLSNIEQPEAFNAVLLAFLSRVQASA